MPTSFPGAVDALSNPTSGDPLTSPSHASQHTNANDAIEAIEGYLLDSEFDYVERTTSASITGTTEGTATSVINGATIAYDGATDIVIEFYSPAITPASDAAGRAMSVVLFDFTTALGVLSYIENQVAGRTFYVPLHAVRRLTPSAASHQYNVKAFVSTGTGTIVGGAGGAGAANMPIILRVRRA